MLPDLLAGRINMAFLNVVNAAPLVKEGKLRAFAVSSRKRSVAAPDLPTMIEKGYPDFEAVPWFGFLAPTGTPQAVIDKVHQDTVTVLAIVPKFGLDAESVYAGLRAWIARIFRVVARDLSEADAKRFRSL